VLDLGCNIGLTVAHYELLWPEAEIVGVELDAGNCELARRNCRRARIVHAAVAAKTGTQTYGGDEEWSFRVDPEGDRSVRARTMAELLDLFETGRVDFVKMDVEGSEWELLDSAGEWAERVGSLLVEVHTPDDKQAAVESMIGSLEAVGFRCRRHEVHWSAIWATRAP
jgi:FkbM family methyltransferase